MRSIRATSGAALSLVVAFGVAHAEATPEAQRIIDRYLAATGGRAAFEAERTLHQRGTVEGFGLTGDAEMWRAAPDRERNVAHLGPLTITQGIAGDRSWRQISGTPLQWSDGKDLDADLAEQWFEAERWCEAAHGGGRVDIAPADAERLPGGETLRITPPRGPSRLVEFNAAGLVERARERRDQLQLTYESSDYRLDAGRVRPHHEAQHVAESPANDTQVTITFTEANIALDDSLFVPGEAQREQRPAFAAGAGAVRVPLTMRESLPWVRVAVNDAAPAWFLVDTGSTLSCIDSAYAARLGLRAAGTVQVQGVGAQTAIHLADIDSLALRGDGGAAFVVRASHLATLDLAGDLGEGSDDRLVGILGGDVLARTVFALDYDAGWFTLADPDSFVAPPGADTLAMTLGSGVPVVAATLDGTHDGHFRLDTGSANGVDLHGAFVAAQKLADTPRCAVEAQALGLGGAVRLRYFRARSLRLGADTLATPIASLSLAAAGAFTSEDYAGNIGTQVLRRLRPSFDYAHRRVFVQRGAAYDEALALDDGLTLLPQQDGWLVRSGARELRRGDLIAALDGDAICVLSHWQLAERLLRATHEAPLRLTVRRGSRTVEMHYPSSR